MVSHEEREHQMDYESFYRDYLELEKQAKESCSQAVKLQKSIAKKMANGEKKSALLDIEALSEVSQRVSETASAMSALLDSFDGVSYLAFGDYATQMLDYCGEYGINAISEAPVFKIFPYEVKIDSANQDVYLDRKKYSYLRPKAFVDIIRAGQEKLNRAPFSAEKFVAELKNVYDIELLREKAAPGSSVYLSQLYKLLIPMSRFKKDYDAQAYAFDLARLYNNLEKVNEEGQYLISIGSGRKGGKLIRILDATGNERFLNIISFQKKSNL